MTASSPESPPTPPASAEGTEKLSSEKFPFIVEQLKDSGKFRSDFAAGKLPDDDLFELSADDIVILPWQESLFPERYLFGEKEQPYRDAAQDIIALLCNKESTDEPPVTLLALANSIKDNGHYLVALKLIGQSLLLGHLPTNDVEQAWGKMTVKEQHAVRYGQIMIALAEYYGIDKAVSEGLKTAEKAADVRNKLFSMYLQLPDLPEELYKMLKEKNESDLQILEEPKQLAKLAEASRAHATDYARQAVGIRNTPASKTSEIPVYQPVAADSLPQSGNGPDYNFIAENQLAGIMSDSGTVLTPETRKSLVAAFNASSSDAQVVERLGQYANLIEEDLILGNYLTKSRLGPHYWRARLWDRPQLLRNLGIKAGELVSLRQQAITALRAALASNLIKDPRQNIFLGHLADQLSKINTNDKKTERAPIINQTESEPDSLALSDAPLPIPDDFFATLLELTQHIGMDEKTEKNLDDSLEGVQSLNLDEEKNKPGKALMAWMCIMQFIRKSRYADLDKLTLLQLNELNGKFGDGKNFFNQVEGKYPDLGENIYSEMLKAWSITPKDGAIEHLRISYLSAQKAIEDAIKRKEQAASASQSKAA